MNYNAESKSQPCIRYIRPVSAICNMVVDAPETKRLQKPVQYFNKKTSMFTANLVEGKKIRLEFDQNQRDKYKRILAHAFLEEGTFLNAEIIKQGYCHAFTKFHFKCREIFRRY